mgnify:CR=1 FL=1
MVIRGESVLSATELLLHRTEQGVWRRGEEYADKGLVDIRSTDEKSAEAVVRGTKPYHVRLAFAGTGISKKCDCPYAAGSKARHAPCKHMVAVAILWDENRGFKRPALARVKATTIPPPLVSRAQINALYDDPLRADLNVLRICVDESGRWSRPHAKLPLMPPFGGLPSASLSVEEVKTAFAEMSRWSRRSRFDPYFCAGEMMAAFCEVLRLVKERLAATDGAAALNVLEEAVRFHHKLLGMIDSSDGVHIFSEAHLLDLCALLQERLADEKARRALEKITGAVTRY